MLSGVSRGRCPALLALWSCRGTKPSRRRGHLPDASIARVEPGRGELRRPEPGVARGAAAGRVVVATPRDARGDPQGPAAARQRRGQQRREGRHRAVGDAGRGGQHRRPGRAAVGRDRAAAGRGEGPVHDRDVAAELHLRASAAAGRGRPAAAPGLLGRGGGAAPVGRAALPRPRQHDHGDPRAGQGGRRIRLHQGPRSPSADRPGQRTTAARVDRAVLPSHRCAVHRVPRPVPPGQRRRR